MVRDATRNEKDRKGWDFRNREHCPERRGLAHEMITHGMTAIEPFGPTTKTPPSGNALAALNNFLFPLIR